MSKENLAQTTTPEQSEKLELLKHFLNGLSQHDQDVFMNVLVGALSFDVDATAWKQCLLIASQYVPKREEAIQ